MLRYSAGRVAFTLYSPCADLILCFARITSPLSISAPAICFGICRREPHAHGWKEQPENSPGWVPGEAIISGHEQVNEMPHSPPPPPADTQNSQQDEAENHFQEIVLELQEAKADELKTLQSRKPSDLLKLVDRGEADEFVSIWEAIASTCQLFDAGPVLIKYLENPLLDRRRRTKAAQTLARMLGLENTHIVFQVGVMHY
eukprot:GHVT01028409.1.p1 GENE.GHVT01028409.1~~GHVT01028409.1.p1  ORF type:complete len:201 (-),score=9.85 GHVT01028409.1:95-697(-)